MYRGTGARVAGKGGSHVRGGGAWGDLRRVFEVGFIARRAVSHAGALVGPPWSKRENGFVLAETQTHGLRMYYEPHCDYDESSVASVGKVDAIVTPANSQVLIKFPLVGFHWQGFLDSSRPDVHIGFCVVAACFHPSIEFRFAVLYFSSLFTGHIHAGDPRCLGRSGLSPGLLLQRVLLLCFLP